MICKGYKRDAHWVNRLHAKNLCDTCYMIQYREEHLIELQAYQEEYRADPAYRIMNKEYCRKYYKTHG